MNVGYLLANSAAKFGRQEAVVCDQGRWSFAQFEERTARLAGAMRAAGLVRGEKVALLFFNGGPFVETYFAAIRVGLVAVPVNFRLVGAEMAYILQDSGAAALFHGPEFLPVIAEIRDQCPALRFVVCPGGERPRALDYEEFLSQGTPCGVDATVTESDQCQLMYTSGTTGRSKGVVISHGNVVWNLFNTILGREDRAGQVSVIVGPLYHTAALNNHFTIQVALGGKSVLVGRFEPETLLRTIEKEKINVISGAPAFYHLLMQHPRANDYDRSSITKCTAGSDKLSQETKRRLLEFFPNIDGVYDVYGCTEASPCIMILTAAQSRHKHGSVGRALPFLEAQVVDESGAPLGPGRVGELVCRGPNVMLGYHNQPHATAEAIRDGWLHTGDLATMDEEGFITIVDRRKDMIVSGGENIYPRQIEELLLGHPQIADVAVVGEPDALWGESVKAVLVLKAGARLSAQEVIEYCKAHLASYKKPRTVVFTDRLPRTASGKVLKGQLRSGG
ncbi:MAG: long-chain-fatty-acid--CoA ligase [Syntrophobacterales bacterium]|nr:MAG: long-chain-fatty-acid--CoA ligase [Syntrophobacterales bacterium]